MNWLFAAVLLMVVVIREVGYIDDKPTLREGDVVKIVGVVEKVKGFDYVVVEGMWVKVPVGTAVEWGDKISVIGSVKCIVPENNSGCLFLNTDHFNVIRGQNWFSLAVHKVRLRLIERILRWIPGDEGALMAGILLGGNDLMTKDGSLAFSRAGLTHIVAASGFNVTMVAGWVSVIFAQLVGKRHMLPFVIVSIVLYMLLAGMGAPVVRAGLMAIMMLSGIALGKKSDWGWLLLIVSLFSLIIYPKWLWEISWQLSVAATAGLMLTSENEQKTFFIWRDIKTTLAVYVTTLPIILVQFGSISIMAPVANALVLWSIPWEMQIGALALVLGTFSDGLGRIVIWLGWPLLKWVLVVTTWFGGLDFATIEGVNMGWVWAIVYYVMLVMGLLWWHRYRKQ